MLCYCIAFLVCPFPSSLKCSFFIYLHKGLIIYLALFYMAFSFYGTSLPPSIIFQQWWSSSSFQSTYGLYIWMRVESFPCSKELKMTLIMICRNYSLFFILTLTLSSYPFPLLFLLNLRYKLQAFPPQQCNISHIILTMGWIHVSNRRVGKDWEKLLTSA